MEGSLGRFAAVQRLFSHPGKTHMKFTRSSDLMNPNDTGLLVVDVQTRLLEVQPQRDRLAWNIRRLLDGAQSLGLRVAATEQVPEKLGATEASLAERLPQPARAKSAFSCLECGDLFQDWRNTGILKILVVGIETHVCVAQTVLDLLSQGFQVSVAADAVGSRYPLDTEIALRRMEMSGALVTTTEAALFEWCREAGTPEFKFISALAKEELQADR